jgi:hypothetical protein
VLLLRPSPFTGSYWLVSVPRSIHQSHLSPHAVSRGHSAAGFPLTSVIWNIWSHLGSILTDPVAAPSKSWVCSRLLAGIAGSNSAGDMVVCLLWVLYFVRYRSLRRADHSCRGVLPSVVCLSVIVKPVQWGGPGPLGAVAP